MIVDGRSAPLRFLLPELTCPRRAAPAGLRGWTGRSCAQGDLEWAPRSPRRAGLGGAPCPLPGRPRADALKQQGHQQVGTSAVPWTSLPRPAVPAVRREDGAVRRRTAELGEGPALPEGLHQPRSPPGGRNARGMCLCQGPVSVRSNLTEEPVVTRVHETVHGRGFQTWPPKAAERAGLVQVWCGGAAAGTGHGVIGLWEQRAAS